MHPWDIMLKRKRQAKATYIILKNARPVVKNVLKMNVLVVKTDIVWYPEYAI